jgi:lipoprotein-anchoring transpeptidase ErfK/SrfK
VAALAVAVASIVAGCSAIALGMTGTVAPRSPRAAVHDRTDRSRPRAVPVLQAAPVVIPPAPSTTTTTTAPAPVVDSTAGTGAGAGTGVPKAWRNDLVPPVLAVGNAAASNITDPSVVATALVRSVPLYPSPGGSTPARTIANPNYLGATDVFLVTGSQDGWVQAYVPERPNETTAWIPAADVSISLVPDHIVVHLGARQLTLYHDNVAVFEAPVAPGEPSSPTPTGSYYVAYIVKLTDPGDAYGPYALGTSAFSNTYYSFDGGPGQVGIHGTDQPWVIGSYASHGCVRLRNSDIVALAQQVVPGTPVEIEN